MSNQERSLLDHTISTKGGRTWSRSKSAQDSSYTSRKSAQSASGKENAVPRAAFMESKAKLKASALSAPGDTSIQEQSPRLRKIGADNQASIKALLDEDGAEQKLASLHDTTITNSQGPPATPTSRLPLADLLANSEHPAARNAKCDTSPDERVFWQLDKSPACPLMTSSLMTPAPSSRRATKRIRSSSPVSSSQDIHSVPQRAPLDSQTLEKSLKTPQADPAEELWNRYAINTGDKLRPSIPPNRALGHLAHSSSPRSIKGGDTAGFRRTASCGIEWPTSKAKRRKPPVPEATVELTGTSPSVHDQLHPKVKSNLSRVNLAVGGTGKTATSPAGKQLSSSSPLPQKPTDPSAALGSPVRLQRSIQSKEPDREQETAIEAVMPADGHHPYPQQPAHASSSDFGGFDDDDLDLSLFEAADNVCEEVTIVQHRKPESTLKHSVSPDPCGEVPSRVQLTDIHKLHSAADIIAAEAVFDTEGDEFNESSDEFGADLEAMVIKFDVQCAGDAAADEKIKTEGNLRTSSHSPMPHFSATDLVELQRIQPDVRIATPDQQRIKVANDSESDDEFGDLGEVDFDLAASSNAIQLPHSSSKTIQAIKRYLITRIDESWFQPSRGGQPRPQKVLQVNDEVNKTAKTIILRESWYNTPCTIDAFVHLIGEFTSSGQCIVDDDRHMVILHPDHLISATVVADSFGCTRRAVLQDRVKATNEASPPQIYGNILHEILQEAMSANRWDTEWLGQLIDALVLRHIESIYGIQLEFNQAVDYLKGKMPELQGWAALFINAQPKPEAVVQDRQGKQIELCINKLLEVEEHVWSPMYGLKGNIDATVQISLEDEGRQKTLTVPLEFKTGRNASNISHRAQTALYTLLLSDRYDLDVAYGILYYMETSDTQLISAIRQELRQMIMQRNELACYVRNRLELPPMLKSAHLCTRCYAKTPCFIYHKLMDGGDGESSGVGDNFLQLVKHLTPAHQEFFRLWDDLLTKEEKDMLKFRRELWTMTSHEREKLGRCFSNVVIETDSTRELKDSPKINRFQYTLIKQMPRAGFSFVGSQIVVGEPIVISDEKGHFALANGYVTYVRRDRITVAVDRRLHNARARREGFDAEKYQSFAGIMEVMREGASASIKRESELEEPITYRLDKDEFSNGMATVRNNLVQLMTNDVFGSQHVRRLIIEGHSPTFKEPSTAHVVAESSSQTSLNVDQRRAIEKVMSAKDYALVLGMPGTGKTTTIAHIIRALVAQGKSVLLTSYTHTAVDNILLKIRDNNIGILRLGSLAKIHHEVQEFATLAATPKHSIAEVREAYHGPQVVATTCLGVNHPIFNERIFDYCIVDEASQITLPVCIGPIRMAKTFVLVGDHNQLPPLVQNAAAREGGLDISLFKLLSDKHPSSVVNLEHQYRMNADIMSLSNTLIYNGLLKCGTPIVAKRHLSLPSLFNLRNHHRSTMSSSQLPTLSNCPWPEGSCWLAQVLAPTLPALFLNTDSLLPSSREVAAGSRVTNPSEAMLTAQIVSALLTAGLAPSSIGIISIYRSQLALLRHSLRRITTDSPIEMHTADKFQGRDKDLIILSLVRSNEAGFVGELLRDWRRINVALTRARSKLLILGSRDTLSRGDPLLGKLVALMESKGWMYNLPPGACDMHIFDGIQGTGPSSPPSLQTSPVRPPPPREMKKEPPSSETRENIQPTTTPVGSSPTTRMERPTPTKEVAKRVKTERMTPKRGRMSDKAILKGRPILRDILNSMS